MLAKVAAGTETYWLNMTNIGLGIVVLICVVVLAIGVIHDLVQRRKQRIRLSREFDRDLKDLVAE